VRPIDLQPTAGQVAGLLAGIADEQLGDPTPCPAWAVADLADHLGGVAIAFAAAADKRRLPGARGHGDGRNLEPGWRRRMGADLTSLADAWRRPGAWDGDTWVGPMDLPADVAGQVALNELLVHGWDLARATGRPYQPDPVAVAAVHRFVTPLAMMDPEGSGAFAPPVPLTEGASELDEVLAHNGRAPTWTAGDDLRSAHTSTTA
jgi:uncharacterized protein (TIGR03086 family)